MEWATLQHLDLRHVGRSSKPLQPHAAAFHPTQALLAVAVGSQIIGTFDTPFLLQNLSFCESIQFQLKLNSHILYVLLINCIMTKWMNPQYIFGSIWTSFIPVFSNLSFTINCMMMLSIFYMGRIRCVYWKQDSFNRHWFSCCSHGL